jgi:hypothetical protein
MSIKLEMPYKIVTARAKRYAAHYNIVPERTLVVPRKMLGSEVACDMRWEDDNGELHLLENKIFVSDNLIPLNPMLEPKLHELWQHYYSVTQEGKSGDAPSPNLTDQ